MGTVKAGSMRAFLKGEGGAEALFGGLFQGSAGVTMEVSWGDIPAGASDVHLSVRLHREENIDGCELEFVNGDMNDGFCDDSVLNNMPVMDYDGDGLDDGFSDGKKRAWAEYLSDSEARAATFQLIHDEEEVDLEDDPNAYMPDSMLEDDFVDDDDFCGDEGEATA